MAIMDTENEKYDNLNLKLLLCIIYRKFKIVRYCNIIVLICEIEKK